MDMLKETEEGVRNLQGNTALGSANGCRSIGSFLKRICDKVFKHSPKMDGKQSRSSVSERMQQSG